MSDKEFISITYASLCSPIGLVHKKPDGIQIGTIFDIPSLNPTLSTMEFPKNSAPFPTSPWHGHFLDRKGRPRSDPDEAGPKVRLSLHSSESSRLLASQLCMECNILC